MNIRLVSMIIGIVLVVTIVIVMIVKKYQDSQSYKDPEVFFIGLDKPGFDTYTTFETFKNIMNKLKLRLATKEEMESVLKKGAQWCAVGFLKTENPDDVCFPMQQNIPGCGEVQSPTVVCAKAKDKKAGINVYGRKPKKSYSKMKVNGIGFVIRPFNELYDLTAGSSRPIKYSKWSIYDK